MKKTQRLANCVTKAIWLCVALGESNKNKKCKNSLKFLLLQNRSWERNQFGLCPSRQTAFYYPEYGQSQCGSSRHNHLKSTVWKFWHAKIFALLGSKWTKNSYRSLYYHYAGRERQLYKWRRSNRPVSACTTCLVYFDWGPRSSTVSLYAVWCKCAKKYLECFDRLLSFEYHFSRFLLY